jgi:hypothetical protein
LKPTATFEPSLRDSFPEIHEEESTLCSFRFIQRFDLDRLAERGDEGSRGF